MFYTTFLFLLEIFIKICILLVVYFLDFVEDKNKLLLQFYNSNKILSTNYNRSKFNCKNRKLKSILILMFLKFCFCFIHKITQF